MYELRKSIRMNFESYPSLNRASKKKKYSTLNPSTWKTLHTSCTATTSIAKH